MPTPADRRLDHRLDIGLPCKLYDPRSRKYLPGVTCNISCGGAMVETPLLRTLRPGDRIHVGWPRTRGAVIEADQMRPGTIRRRLCSQSNDTILAIEFDERIALLTPDRLARAA